MLCMPTYTTRWVLVDKVAVISLDTDTGNTCKLQTTGNPYSFCAFIPAL